MIQEHGNYIYVKTGIKKEPTNENALYKDKYKATEAYVYAQIPKQTPLVLKKLLPPRSESESSSKTFRKWRALIQYVLNTSKMAPKCPDSMTFYLFVFKTASKMMHLSPGILEFIVFFSKLNCDFPKKIKQKKTFFSPSIYTLFA